MQIEIPGLHSVTEKRCPKCRITKSVGEFAIRVRGNKVSPSSYCRGCQREYSRSHYGSHRVAHNRRRRVHQAQCLVRNRQLMNEYLASKACIDCGNDNPIVLEFDHVRGSKRFDVSTMARGGFSWRRVLEEIAKCEIRCANCHRIRTAFQRGWKGRVVAEMNGQSHGR